MNLKTRDSYFDNLKFFLILCVIIGNSLESIYQTAIDVDYIILLLYLFHMPLFTFISGYFCKKSRRTTQEKVVYTVKLYVFAQIFYYLFNRIIFEENSNFQLLSPNWTLWYLLSLIFWYIISDYIHNYKKAFIISIILSLVLGFDESISSHVSISRTIFFLPFFIAGLSFDKDKFLEKYKKYTFHILLLVFIVLGILFAIKDITFVQLLFEYTYYTYYTQSPIFPFLIRIFHYIGAFIIGGFILVVFPSKKTFLSCVGRDSLVLYISHIGIIQLLTKRPILKYENPLQFLLSEICIVLVVILFTYLYRKFKTKLIHLKSKIKIPPN